MRPHTHFPKQLYIVLTAALAVGLALGAARLPAATAQVTDTTPPDTTITGTPPNPQTYSAQFTFTGADDVTLADQLTFVCSLDGAAFTACVSPYDVMDLLPGFHNFQVGAVDAAGNVDPTPASFTWEVRPLCGFPMATIYVDWMGIIRGGPGNGQPYALTLTGTAGADVMFGSPFDDTINGLGGADTICAGAGNDTVNAAAGNDTVYGLDGNDMLNGGNGNDNLNGGTGFDTLNGEAGADTLNGFLGNDTLNGGNDNDTLIGGPRINPVPGAVDNDTLNGQGGNDTLTGGAEADALNGGAGTDIATDYDPTQDTISGIP